MGVPQKIVITGGLGFIGTNLIEGLDRDRYGITVLDNMSNPAEDKVPGDIELVEGDIRDADLVQNALKGADIVINLAAHTRVIESIDDPVFNFETNVVGSFNVLEAMRKHNVGTIITASTGGAIVGEVEPPVHEEIAARPASPYGASKLAVEGYCSAYAESYGIKAASLRFSNIYGPHSRNKGSVVAAFIKDIISKRQVTVYGDGSQTRDYLYVSDLATGIIQAIESGKAGVYQLGAGKPTDLNRLIEILEKVLPCEFKVNYEPFRAGEVRHTYCNIDKAAKTFAYKPAISLEQGIDKTWDWFKQQGLDS